jgi:hypothetical protein
MTARESEQSLADIVLLVHTGKRRFPMAVIEFGKDGSKEAQALSYAVNFQPYMNWVHVMLVAEIIYLKKKPCMTVSCVQMAHSMAETSLVRVVLWRGEYSDKTWSRLLLAIEKVVEANDLADKYNVAAGKESNKKKTWERNRRAAIESNEEGKKLCVWKEVRSQKSAEYMKELIKECNVYELPGNRALVSCPYVEGDHKATTLGQFAAFLADIASVHKAGFVHGDIRLGNTVFSEQKGKLIDHELCGRISHDKYPAG